ALNQRRKDFHHLVDLAELILGIVADGAILAGDPQRLQPRLAARRQGPVLGAVMPGIRGLPARNRAALQALLVALPLELQVEACRFQPGAAPILVEPGGQEQRRLVGGEVLGDVPRLVAEDEAQPLAGLDRDLARLGRFQLRLRPMIAAELEPGDRAIGKGGLHRRHEFPDAVERAQCRSLVVRKRIFGQSCLARSAHHAFCARKTGASFRSSAMFIFWAAMKRLSSSASSLSTQRATSKPMLSKLIGTPYSLATRADSTSSCNWPTTPTIQSAPTMRRNTWVTPSSARSESALDICLVFIASARRTRRMI